MMAQNITGKVMNTKGEPLAFANVVLLNRTDSAFVKGAVSGEDGSFVIDTSCNGEIIKVTSVGYKTVCKDCTGENVGIIKMEEDSKMLGSVLFMLLFGAWRFLSTQSARLCAPTGRGWRLPRWCFPSSRHTSSPRATARL